MELKLLEKKKTELALKSRKEIADYVANGKVERAKIRVEHIIREDYLVEAMEIVEMFCDLLLGRFGLIQQMKTLDDGLAEAISSIIWVAPRLQTDVQELKIVSDQLAAKYGKPYAMACRENGVGTVSQKLMHKLSVQAPPKLTVEKYMIEIAKYYNVEYEPDPQVLSQDEVYAADALIDLAPAPPLPEKNDLNSPGSGSNASAPPPTNGNHGPGGYAPFNYPPQGHPHGGVPPAYGGGAMGYPPPDMGGGAVGGVSRQPDLPPTTSTNPPPVRSESNEDNTMKNNLDFPELPGVPHDSPLKSVTPDNKEVDDEDVKNPGDESEIDFDDLTRRFEALKK
eukprot:TCALIF_04491-PA protein Name:"Similar to Ist1 IST1 homolog (Mus musculus)" AED:0.39 eAED:0.39 QI:0/0.5/0.4/0.8/0.75/0.8/5/0/337